MSKYWSERIDEETLTLMDKEEYQIRKELAKLYKEAMDNTIIDITYLYFDIIAEQKEETVYLNSLYRYDRLYKIQAQLNKYLHELGEQEIKIYNRQFNQMYEDVQKKISALQPDFKSVDANRADAIVKTIWCSDGKHFSDRVWGSADKLRTRLIQGLSDTIIRGASPDELKKTLMKEFNVAFNEADRITRTELNRIRNQAMVDRYVAAGYEKYRIYTAKDDKVCQETCAPKENVWYNLSEAKAGINMPPLHPNCRCGIIAQDKAQNTN